jgi:hypothetical protein
MDYIKLYHIKKGGHFCSDMEYVRIRDHACNVY